MSKAYVVIFGVSKPASGECDHVSQVADPTPTGGRHLHFWPRREEAEGDGATSDTDDHHPTARSRDFERQLQRGTAPDDVEHDIDAAATGQLHHLGRIVGAGEEGVVGAHLGGQSQGLRLGVDGDDGCWAQRPEELQSDVAETADTDDQRSASGPERIERAPNRPVRRDGGVGEWGREGRRQVAERHELTDPIDQHERRHPAIHAESPTRTGHLGLAIAEVLVAGLAMIAEAAAQGAEDGYRFTDFDTACAGPNASTQPAFSCPSVNGGEPFIVPSSNSCRTCRSLWQSPAAPTLTST